MLKRAKVRGLLLALLFLASVFLTLRSSSDVLPRWLQGTRAESWLLQFPTGNQNIHDIAMGIIVSLLIYFVVVWLPERDKRKRVRRNLRRQYDSFKEGCIAVFLSAINGGYDPALIDGLKHREQFMRFFTEPFCDGQTRWHAVANGLRAENIRSLIVEFEVLIAEVRYTLTAVDVENQEVFDFLNGLAIDLYRARNCAPEYDGVKSLLRLMWSVFAESSLTEGDTSKDVIGDMIEAM